MKKLILIFIIGLFLNPLFSQEEEKPESAAATLDELLELVKQGRFAESAEASEGKNEDALINGIGLLRSKIERFLENKKIEPFGSEGEVLDPELHDAMLTHTDKKKDDNTILSVFEKGYRYHDKVIRHAKVVVNKK